MSRVKGAGPEEERAEFYPASPQVSTGEAALESFCHRSVRQGGWTYVGFRTEATFRPGFRLLLDELPGLMMNLNGALQTQHRSAFSTGVIPDWFHGIIPRKTAEELLMTKPRGYFLIRVSESRTGYTLSYRAEDRCRHFMIDMMEDGHYIIVGEKRHHRFLQDLVDFHRHTPIFPYTEVLTVACGKDFKTDYAELLFPQRHLRNDTGLQPHRSLLPSPSGPVPPKEVPPALPYRPHISRNSDVQEPTRQALHATSLYPDIPVAKPRIRYKADDLQSTRSPEVPVRNFVPQVERNKAGISLPAIPSIPPARGVQVCTNTDTVKNLEAKPSVVSNLKILNKIFPTKKSQSQEFVDIDNPENTCKEVAVEQTLNSYILCSDAGLPPEYLPPPPFAPGY